MTDPLGLDAGAEALAFFAGAADGLTGGVSSMIFGAFVPGYDCFIQEHNTAFQVGSVTAQVVAAVVTVVATGGVGLLAVAGRYIAANGVKAAAKVPMGLRPEPTTVELYGCAGQSIYRDLQPNR